MMRSSGRVAPLRYICEDTAEVWLQFGGKKMAISSLIEILDQHFLEVFGGTLTLQ